MCPAWHSMRHVRSHTPWLPWGLLLASCGDSAVIVLGNQQPDRWHFDPPELVRGLESFAKTDNPSPTADLLEIYFTSERGGAGADIWRAERSDATRAFDPPVRVAELSSTRTETSPVLSADGLECWFASDRPGGPGQLDIWHASRSERHGRWPEPSLVPELSSAGRDIPRPLGEHAQVMPLSSDRDAAPNLYQTYFARVAFAATFGPPEPVPELWHETLSSGDAFLTDDGLNLFFVRGPAFGPADLFVVARRSVAEPFAFERGLDDLNSAADERDPWLSADGRQLFFSSNRSGEYQIYVASAQRQ